MIKGGGGSRHKKLKAFRIASENDKLTQKIEELKAIIEKDETYIEIITGYSEEQKVKVEELLQSTKKDEAKEMFSYL